MSPTARKMLPLIPLLALAAAMTLMPFGAYGYHVADVARADRDIDLGVRLGDSITAWAPPDGTLNLGIPGDTLAGALWRIDRGALPASVERVTVALGINDLHNGHSSTQVAADTLELAARIRHLRPTAVITVTAILPTANPARRKQAREVTLLLHTSGQAVTDYGGALLDAAGEPYPGVFVDGLHLSAAGYQRIAAQPPAVPPG